MIQGPGSSGFGFFRVQVFEGPDPESRVQVQGPGPGLGVLVQGLGPGSGSRFSK